MVVDGTRYEFELWRSGAGKSLLDISNTTKQLVEFITKYFHPIAFCDLKWFLDSIKVPGLFNKVQHLDLLIPPIESTGNSESDSVILNTIANSVIGKEAKPWMSYIANAIHVYREIELEGLLWNYTKVQPKWDYYTYTGRSRCTQFNVQGHSEPDLIVRTGVPSEAFLLHFDWSCADMRMLGLLSGDETLLSTFEDSDPYTVVSKVLEISRSEAKGVMLKDIYSLNLDGLMHSLFPKACDWLKSKVSDAENKGYTSTSFGRSFHVSGERTVKSAVNAVLQGSVATLAQVVISKIYTLFPMYLITDTFDGVVLSVPKDEKIVCSTIKDTKKIMNDPFGDGSFIMKSSANIGTGWGNWQSINI